MLQSRPAFVSGIVMTAVGLVLAAALFWWLPHCHTEMVMKCVWMTRAAAGASLVIAALGVVMMFSPSAGAAIGALAGIIFTAMLEMALATVLIGPCLNPMMGCHAVTRPTILVAGALIALIALAEMWRLSKLAR